MKWFRHQTASHDDERLVALLEEGGLKTYGCFWFVLELIAAQMGNDDTRCSVTYPLKRWANLCNERPSSFRVLVQKLSKLGLVSVATEGKLVEISCQNLLKHRDEYSIRKASRHTTKKGVSGKCPEDDAKESAPEQSIAEQNTTHQTTADESNPSGEDRPTSKAAHEVKLKEAFDGQFWPNYPRKVSKAAAFKAFGKVFPRGQDEGDKLRRWENLSLHLGALQAEFAERDKAELKYCPYPAKWLNVTDFDSMPEDGTIPQVQTWEAVVNE